MSLPKYQKAIVTDGNEKASLHTDVPIPKIPEGYVLVKNTHVGLNPTDWKHIEHSEAGFVVGCDFAGTVIEVSSGLARPIKKGDRVAGFSHGVKSDNPQSGAFAEYIIAKPELIVRLPDRVSDAEAAAYVLGFITVGQGMYQSLQLPWPDHPTKDNTPILIYGGSGGMGILAIQFAKLSGFKPIVTCSPRNNDFVKKLGAAAAFDYKDPNCGQKIREYTNNKLMYAWDTIAEAPTAHICAAALSSDSGVRYAATLPSGVDNLNRPDAAVNEFNLGYTAAGEPFRFLMSYDVPAKPQDAAFSIKWMDQCERLIADGKLVIEPTMKEGGLQGIFGGLSDLKEGRVSGQKLVYKVA